MQCEYSNDSDDDHLKWQCGKWNNDQLKLIQRGLNQHMEYGTRNNKCEHENPVAAGGLSRLWNLSVYVRTEFSGEHAQWAFKLKIRVTLYTSIELNYK